MNDVHCEELSGAAWGAGSIKYRTPFINPLQWERPRMFYYVLVLLRFVHSEDTLIIAESSAANLKVFRAITFPLHPQDGFTEVGQLIRNGTITLDNYRFIVLLFGRADLWEVLKEFKDKVADCLRALRDASPEAVVLVTSTLPAPTDDFRIPSRVGMRNNYLSLLADESAKVEFAKPGKALICSGRVSQAFFDGKGNLNQAGLELVRHGLENKFRCGHLRAKFGHEAGNWRE